MIKLYCDRCKKEVPIRRRLSQKLNMEIPWPDDSDGMFIFCQDCEDQFVDWFCNWMGVEKEDVYGPDEIPF